MTWWMNAMGVGIELLKLGYVVFSSSFEHVATVRQYFLNFLPSRLGGFVFFIVQLACTTIIFWIVVTAFVRNAWFPVCLFGTFHLQHAARRATNNAIELFLQRRSKWTRSDVAGKTSYSFASCRVMWLFRELWNSWLILSIELLCLNNREIFVGFVALL